MSVKSASRAKTKHVKSVAKAGIFVFLAFLIIGCVHLVSYYDAVSYKNLTDLKAETLVLVDDITESPNQLSYADKLNELRLHIEKAFEYEKGKELNDNTAAQLEEIRKMLNGMISLLKEQGKLSNTYLVEKRRQFNDAFTLAIATENLKIRRKF